MSIPFLAHSWQKKPRSSLLGGIAMMTVQADAIVNHPLEATAAWLSDVAGDPVAFVSREHSRGGFAHKVPLRESFFCKI